MVCAHLLRAQNEPTPPCKLRILKLFLLLVCKALTNFEVSKKARLRAQSRNSAPFIEGVCFSPRIFPGYSPLEPQGARDTADPWHAGVGAARVGTGTGSAVTAGRDQHLRAVSPRDRPSRAEPHICNADGRRCEQMNADKNGEEMRMNAG